MAALSATDVQQILDSPQTVTKETVRDLISELKPEYRIDLEEIGVDKITKALNSPISTFTKDNYLSIIQYSHLQKVEEERNQQALILSLINKANEIVEVVDKKIKNIQDPNLIIQLQNDRQVAANSLEALIREQQKQALLLKLSDALARESIILQKRADLEERRIDEFLKDNPELNKATPELSRKAALEKIHQFDKEYQANAAGQIKALGKFLRKDAEEAAHLENQSKSAENEVNNLEQAVSYEHTLQPSKVRRTVKNVEELKRLEEELTLSQKNVKVINHKLEKLETTFEPQTWIKEKKEELNIKNHGNSSKFSPAPYRH